MTPSNRRVTIYHNPQCGTSRNVLALIREAGIEPQVIDYQKTPYTRALLAQLLAAAGLRPREALRVKGDLYQQLELARPALSDEQLLDAMVTHPVLVERPFVVTSRGTALCRPKEKVLDLL